MTEEKYRGDEIYQRGMKHLRDEMCVGAEVVKWMCVLRANCSIAYIFITRARCVYFAGRKERSKNCVLQIRNEEETGGDSESELFMLERYICSRCACVRLCVCV